MTFSVEADTRCIFYETFYVFSNFFQNKAMTLKKSHVFHDVTVKKYANRTVVVRCTVSCRTNAGLEGSSCSTRGWVKSASYLLVSFLTNPSSLHVMWWDNTTVCRTDGNGKPFERERHVVEIFRVTTIIITYLRLRMVLRTSVVSLVIIVSTQTKSASVRQ